MPAGCCLWLPTSPMACGSTGLHFCPHAGPVPWPQPSLPDFTGSEPIPDTVAFTMATPSPEPKLELAWQRRKAEKLEGEL
ncbi:hypothetical protein AAY473_040420 [Plecturocebus cupreus]